MSNALAGNGSSLRRAVFLEASRDLHGDLEGSKGVVIRTEVVDMSLSKTRGIIYGRDVSSFRFVERDVVRVEDQEHVLDGAYNSSPEYEVSKDGIITERKELTK